MCWRNTVFSEIVVIFSTETDPINNKSSISIISIMFHVYKCIAKVILKFQQHSGLTKRVTRNENSSSRVYVFLFHHNGVELNQFTVE